MLISTKGRYALRVMVELAERRTDAYIPLKDIADKQEISPKYLETIMTVLSKAGFVDALHGRGGGFRLNREPSDYTVASVLRLTEGSLSPVACLEEGENSCTRSGNCRTLPMWTELNRLINDYLEGVTVGDLAESVSPINFVI